MFDFVLLFKRDIENEETPSFTSKFPEKLDFPQSELQYIIPNAIPRKLERSDVFMFNTPSFYCYDYSFKIKNIEAAVIIVSSHFHPSLYIDFLRAIDNSFNMLNPEMKNNSSGLSKKKTIIQKIEENQCADLDTEVFCRFVYVHSLLTSWSSNDDGDLVINYPFDSFIIKLSPDVSIYSPKYKTHTCNQYQYIAADAKHFYQPLTRNDDIKAEDEAISALHSWTDVFDVAPLVPHVETLWAAAIQNKGVMIVAPTASIASYSAVSILSMLEPMKYSEPCLLFSQIGDPRFTVENLAPSAVYVSKNTKLREKIQSFNDEDYQNKDNNKFIPKNNNSDIQNENVNSYIEDNLITITDDNINQTIENQISRSTSFDSVNNSLLNNTNLDSDSENSEIIPSQYKIVATTYESYVKLVRTISSIASLSESQSISLLNMNFSAIITIKSTNFRPTHNLKRIYSKKTKQVLKKFLSLMNLTLLSDPYFDLLEKEIDEKQFVRIWPNDNIICAATIANISQNQNRNQNVKSSNSNSYSSKNNKNTGTDDNINTNNNPNENYNLNNDDNSNNNDENANNNEKTINNNDDNKNNLNDENNIKVDNLKLKENKRSFYSQYTGQQRHPSPDELIDFYKNIQKTTTFKKWRHIREDRDQLRMGFLSVLPKEAVEQVPDDKLQEAYEKVSLLLNIHKKDEHFRIILQKNLSLIKKRIRNLRPL